MDIYTLVSLGQIPVLFVCAFVILHGLVRIQSLDPMPNFWSAVASTLSLGIAGAIFMWDGVMIFIGGFAPLEGSALVGGLIVFVVGLVFGGAALVLTQEAGSSYEAEMKRQQEAKPAKSDTEFAHVEKVAAFMDFRSE